VKKVQALRDMMLSVIPELHAHPENLTIFVNDGRITCRATGTLSFEYAYNVNIVIQDFTGDEDQVVVPLLTWIASNEPDLLERAPHQPFGFDIELLDSNARDIAITLPLTELVKLTQVESGIMADHLAEPARIDAGFPGVDGVKLWQGVGEALATGDTIVVGG
jgi:hypothetical protein